MIKKITFRKRLLFWVSFVNVGVFVLIGCSRNNASQFDATILTSIEPSIQSPRANTELPTMQSSPLPTSTIEKHLLLTSTPTLTLTLTPTSKVILDIIEIEKSVYNGNNQEVSTAFWSSDGQTIYYALGFPSYSSGPLKWRAYDIKNARSYDIPDTPLSNRAIWLPSLGHHMELQGLESPSGRYILQSQTSKSDPLLDSVYVLDNHSQEKKIILDGVSGIVRRAAWYDDEKKAIFDIGYYGDPELFAADLENNSAVPIREVTDFDGYAQYWALSPNGDYLVILDFLGTTQFGIVSLEDGQVEVINERAKDLTWSFNSQLVYYWQITQDFSLFRLRAYDVSHKIHKTILDIALLKDQGLCILYQCSFDVSPEGNQLVIWEYGGKIWLVTFDR